VTSRVIVQNVPELRHLRYFVAVAEELSFSRAADRLHMAPSPLSAAIRRLEAELGVDRFVRTTRHVELTDAGRRLLAEGAGALAAVEAAFANATRAGQGVIGTLRLGVSTVTRYELRPALLALLRDRAPGIQADVSMSTTGALVRELLSRRLDVAVTFCLEPTPGLARRILTRERMCVLMRSQHRLAEAGEVRFEQLRGNRFVVAADELAPGFNRRLRALCAEHGYEPATVLGTDIWDDEEWPAGDDVITLVPERARRHLHAGLRLAALEPELRLPIEIAWREDEDSPLVRTFLAITRDVR
jgi:DNA-binding transcriptional LysR family regulator